MKKNVPTIIQLTLAWFYFALVVKELSNRIHVKLKIKDMNQVDGVRWCEASIGTNKLFILDGRDSTCIDLIHAWKLATETREFRQHVKDYCRNELGGFVFGWKSPGGQERVTFLVEDTKTQVNWGSLGKLDLPSNVEISGNPNNFIITETYSAGWISISLESDGKKKSARMKPATTKSIHVGSSYETFDRKDRKKLLRQVREGKDIPLKNFISAELRMVSFLDIDFRNEPLITLIQGIFKRGNPQIQFDNSGKVREKICWNSNCQASKTKLLKCTGCRRAQYCDTECQIEDWWRHVDYCVKKQEKRKLRANKTGNPCSVCLDKDSCVD